VFKRGEAPLSISPLSLKGRGIKGVGYLNKEWQKLGVKFYYYLQRY
jgi:hypothetical protein